MRVPLSARGATLFAILALASCRDRPAPPAPAPLSPPPIGRSWKTLPAEPAATTPIAERLPRVGYRGGPFLRNPRIVTVTFAGDDPTIVTRVRTFGEQIGRTEWWREVVDSYCLTPEDCVGEASAAPPVELRTQLPAKVRDVDIDDILEREVTRGGFGPIGPNTLLLTYLPSGVALSSASVEEYCRGRARAFHRSLRVNGGLIPYAIIPRCGDEAELTGTASHELLEATTSPDPNQRGFAFERDSAHLGFYAAGLEPVDPCGLLTMDSHWTFASGFVVHRAWSNRAASAGHDPCVPARAGRPYVAMVSREPTVRLPTVGERATITLEAVSDRPVPGWAVSAFDLSGYHDGSSYVDVSVDKTQVHAGETATLTIVVRKLHPAQVATVAVVSTIGVLSFMWPVAISMR